VQDEEAKRISSWAAISFAPTLIGSIYGMNFAHMPELGWRAGCPAAVTAMAAASASLYLLFRRRDWL
jgi:magnesium transporter